jgi:hypothetical protein
VKEGRREEGMREVDFMGRGKREREGVVERIIRSDILYVYSVCTVVCFNVIVSTG